MEVVNCLLVNPGSARGLGGDEGGVTLGVRRGGDPHWTQEVATSRFTIDLSHLGLC